MKNQIIKNTTSVNTQSWNWYKAWTTTLLHPNQETWKALLSEGGISFRQAYTWITITSLFFPFAATIAAIIKGPFAINWSNISNLLKNYLIAIVLEPFSILLFTGFIHILAKLFGSKGTFVGYFVIFAAISSPIRLFYDVTALFRWILASNFALFLGILLTTYGFFLYTDAIRVNYRFRWLGAFLISFIVTALACLTILGIYSAIIPK
jgi:hypothetical protein